MLLTCSTSMSSWSWPPEFSLEEKTLDISTLLEPVLGSNNWTQYSNVITYFSNEQYKGLQFEIR